jgi:hypothetical protein
MITNGYIWPMPTYFTGQEIALGDWVKVYVPRLGVWHHGIVRTIYPVCDCSGLEEIEASYYERGLITDAASTFLGFAVEIAHNMKATGVTVSDWDDFADGNQVHLHRHASIEHVQEILARVEVNIGKPYHVFNQNCEHFASYAYTGRAESKSVQVVGWSVAIVAGIAIFNRH